MMVVPPSPADPPSIDAYVQKTTAQLVLWNARLSKLIRLGRSDGRPHPNPDGVLRRLDRAWSTLLRFQGADPTSQHTLRADVEQSLQAVEEALHA